MRRRGRAQRSRSRDCDEARVAGAELPKDRIIDGKDLTPHWTWRCTGPSPRLRNPINAINGPGHAIPRASIVRVISVVAMIDPS